MKGAVVLRKGFGVCPLSHCGCNGWLLRAGDGRCDVYDGGILDDPVGYGRLAAVGKKGI